VSFANGSDCLSESFAKGTAIVRQFTCKTTDCYSRGSRQASLLNPQIHSLPSESSRNQSTSPDSDTESPRLPDVSNSSDRQIEDRGDTSSAPASGSRHTRGGPGVAILGLSLTGLLLTAALVSTFYPGGGQKPSATHPIPPTNTTQPTSPSQPNNPPRAFVGREERDLSHGLRRIPLVSRTQTCIWAVSLTLSSLPLVFHRPEPLVIGIGEEKVKESGPAVTHASQAYIFVP
jgi:hypothetical protein